MLHGSVALGEILARCFNGFVIIAQACLLDYFMVTRGGLSWLGWIAADLVVITSYTVLNVFAIHYFMNMRKTKAPQMGLLPYAFVIWTIYSVVLAAKVATMFKTFARELPDKGWFGTNLMKIAIGLAAAVFALLIAGHHHTRASERHRFCLKWMQTHVVFELLDTVEFLSILFVNESEVLLSWSVESAIIGYAVINLIVPAVALFQLSGVNFALSRPKENFILIQNIIATVLVNIPYVVIRLYLWHTSDFTTALFIMKNFIAIVNTFWEMRTLIPYCRYLDFLEDHDEELNETELEPIGRSALGQTSNVIHPDAAVPGEVRA